LTKEELEKKKIAHTQIELGSDDEEDDDRKDMTLFDQSTIELASQNDDLLAKLQEVQQQF